MSARKIAAIDPPRRATFVFLGARFASAFSVVARRRGLGRDERGKEQQDDDDGNHGEQWESQQVPSYRTFQVPGIRSPAYKRCAAVPIGRWLIVAQDCVLVA